jgi:hypothetical protein
MKKERQDETQFPTRIDGFLSTKQNYDTSSKVKIGKFKINVFSDRGGSCVTSSLQGVSICQPSRLLQQNLAAFHHF